MKHAGPAALDRLEPLLVRLRKLPGLKERSRGVFYRGSKAFLHFHEDPAGLFADLRSGDGFERLPATSARERTILLSAVGGALADGKRPVGRSRTDASVRTRI